MDKDLVGHRKRLKERFEKSPSATPDYELLELLLGYVIKGKDVKGEAKDLMKFIDGNFNKIYQKDILQLSGIGNETKLFFEVIREFYRRMNLQIVKNDLKTIKSPSDVFDFFRFSIGLDNKESFVALALNSAGNILEYKMLFNGTVNFSQIHIREIVEFAIKSSATSIIVAHNHPSGKLTPSSEDIIVSKKIEDALKLVEINFLDHIIVSTTGALSMLKEGYLRR
ncbi:MAG: DNA repair protein RadC [Calditerrivibrio sp.]|nr:DNA repair protein RadC [Calditerrivibrio sp.]MCA1932594.1 DNA repair protein RadC [Calditerrivibrio sp.]MCA1980319.1 DNA repair protein RadC [Calditerrivibrio sp.]